MPLPIFKNRQKQTYTQMLRDAEFRRRGLILGEVKSFDKCVKSIPEGVDPETRYRVVGLTNVRWGGQTIRLQDGLVFRVSRYGTDAVRKWVESQDLHLELVDAPAQDMTPFYEHAKSMTIIEEPAASASNEAVSCDEAPGCPVEAFEKPDAFEPSSAKRKPGRPPSAKPFSNPFGRKVK